MIKAILFDFDGVILESMDIKTKAFADLFSDYPEYVEQIVKLHIDNGGMSRFEKFKIIYKSIIKKPLSPAEMELLNKKFSEYVYQSVLDCPFVAGSYELLNKYHKEYLFFVVSGTPQEEMISIVKERKLSGFFVNIYGSPEDKTTLVAKVLRDYKLRPEEVLFIGDAINDYEGATNNGVEFIGRVRDKNINPFIKLKIKRIIKNLFGLEQYLKEISNGEKI
ncbi:HAD family hydrolase [bacterium]|nr:HAD family hydrolase [bacterium]